MKKFFYLLPFLLVSLGHAQQPPLEQAHWLAQRAASSDLVMIGQLERVDYEYEGSLPIDGEAWFRPLIRYKAPDRFGGLVIVNESGLSANECYFPKSAPWDERPRYLLFLIVDEETAMVRGHPDGCALEILVNMDGRYAARWPQPGLGGENGRGDEQLQALVEEMTFQGPGARIDASDILAHQRRQRAERDFMRLEDATLIPTRGIELGQLRALMQPGLALDDDEKFNSERLEELRERMTPSAESDDSE
ncbi:MAG: hypothetical protein RQ741_09705 [Wenzhouxiangellaceae bacterium]|nr:hypothetical protein [Wenzhouxiangellaceae bacterium]